MSDPSAFTRSETHASVDQYLDDLARMLSSATATERSDVLASVREYIDDSVATLERPATPADFARILDQLGPADVAADIFERGLATVGDPGAGAARASHAGGPRLEAPEGTNSLGGVALGLGIAALALCLLPFLGLAVAIGALVTAIVALRATGVNRTSAKVGLWLAGLACVVGLLTTLAPIGLLAFRTGEFSEGDTTHVSAPVQAPDAQVTVRLL